MRDRIKRVEPTEGDFNKYHFNSIENRTER